MLTEVKPDQLQAGQIYMQDLAVMDLHRCHVKDCHDRAARMFGIAESGIAPRWACRDHARAVLDALILYAGAREF